MNNGGRVLAPWHLWGSTDALTVVGPTDSIVRSDTIQLARVDYGRPETWTFFLAATLETVTGTILPVSFGWDITIGLGRSTYQMKFVENADLAIQGRTFYTTSILGPDRSPTNLGNNIITEFPAQSIQCVGRCQFSPATSAGATIKLSMSAFFAPKNHIRPEWYFNQFSGNEQNGT